MDWRCCYASSMETRSRRTHGIRSRKVSISVSEADLAVLVARARRLHRNNVSAVVHEMVESLKREEALDHLIGKLGGADHSDAELDALRAEMVGKPTGPVRRRGGRAA